MEEMIKDQDVMRKSRGKIERKKYKQYCKQYY